MEWYLIVIIGLLVITICEGLLLVKRSNEINKMIEFVKSEKYTNSISDTFISAYKNRVELIEQNFKEEILKVKTENDFLKEELTKIKKLSYEKERELLDQLKTVFESIKELKEEFRRYESTVK